MGAGYNLTSREQWDLKKQSRADLYLAQRTRNDPFFYKMLTLRATANHVVISHIFYFIVFFCGGALVYIGGAGAPASPSLAQPMMATYIILLGTHTHTMFLWLTGTLHRRNGFYTVQTIFYIALQQLYTYTYPLQETLCIFTFSKKRILYDFKAF